MSYFLTTARLGFRTWTAADLSLAIALWTDPDVMSHMGGPMSVNEAQARMHLEMERQQNLGIQYWPIFSLETNQHAGCAGLRPFHDKPGVLEIGVHIARPFWSGRYGEEAARAVIAHAWARTGANTLVAGHGPENDNSKAMILRLGFVFTHTEPWGPLQRMHPYYALSRP